MDVSVNMKVEFIERQKKRTILLTTLTSTGAQVRGLFYGTFSKRTQKMPRNIRAALRQHPIPDSDGLVLKMAS